MSEKEELMNRFKEMIEILKRNNEELQKSSNGPNRLYSICNQNFDIIENIEDIVNELTK